MKFHGPILSCSLFGHTARRRMIECLSYSCDCAIRPERHICNATSYMKHVTYVTTVFNLLSLDMGMNTQI